MLLEESLPRYCSLPELLTIPFLSDQRAHQCIGFWALYPKRYKKTNAVKLMNWWLFHNHLRPPLSCLEDNGLPGASLHILCIFFFTLLKFLGETGRIIKQKSKDYTHTSWIIKWLSIDCTFKFSPYEAILQKLYKLEEVQWSPTTHVPNIFWFILLVCFTSTDAKHLD